ncbi:hypothetical protein EI555_003460, partial [Monodon monoceros]
TWDGRESKADEGTHSTHLSLTLTSSVDVDQGPPGLTAYVSSEGQIQYDRPMKNFTFTFSSLLYTVDSMLLCMDKELWLLNIDKATPETLVDSNLYDQIMFFVAVRRRPSLYVISPLVPRSFLIATDALSFFLPAESENRAPFKMTLLLGYNVFLLMTLNDLLPASGAPCISMVPPTFRGSKGSRGHGGRQVAGEPLPLHLRREWILRKDWIWGKKNCSVYFAQCLSLMVVRLLETIFITYLLHLATTQPPPRPRWLRSLLLHCTSPRKCCPAAPQKRTRAWASALPTCLEDEAQKQHSVSLWMQFSHMMDTLLFSLYLLFLAPSIVTVIILWNT